MSRILFRNLKPDSISTIMAYYRSLSINTEKDLIFSVQSKNEKGYSVEKSNLTVPKKSKRCSPPENIKKILTTENTNIRKYMLSWSPPLFGGSEIISYTVFWCNTKDESPSKCDVSVLLSVLSHFWSLMLILFFSSDVN